MKNLVLTILITLGSFSNLLFAQLKLPYTFENRSRYADNEIYIGLVGKTNELGDVWMDMVSSELKVMSAEDNTILGPEWSFPQDWLYPEIFTKLSDIENNTIQIPHGLYGCRIFISFESPMYLRFHETGGYAGANLSNPGDPNTGIRWEIVELTWGDAGLWTNTSRVDAYQYPMGLEVNGFFGGIDPSLTYEELYNAGINGAGTPQFKKIGELLSHQEILQAWDDTVSDPYLAAKIIKEQSIDGEPIIEQPSKVHEFPNNILDDYIEDIWTTFKNHDLVLDIGDRGIWRGRVGENNVLSFTDPADGSVASIYGKPSTIDALEGAGFLASSNSTNPEIILEDLMIQAQISAAITRHAIYTNIIDGSVQDTHDANRFFQISPYNEYVKFFHSEEISFESQTYAFAYDDVGDHSSTIQSTFPTDVKVIIGGYGENNKEQSILTSVKITTENESFTTEDTIKFDAQAYDQNNQKMNTDIIWSISSGEAIINENGYFNTTIAGDYIITATQGDVSDDYVLIITAPEIIEECNGAPNNGLYSYTVTNENNNPSITFIPENGNGAAMCILHYGTGVNSNFSNHEVTPNTPFQINANAGETIHFYYTYSLAEGGERNSAEDVQSFQVGNCSATIGLFEFDDSTDFGNNFTIYPNPTNGKDAYVSGLNENVSIDIYTLNGKLLSSDVTINVKTVKLKTSNLSNGLYLVAVNTKDGKFSKTFKLIVN